MKDNPSVSLDRVNNSFVPYAVPIFGLYFTTNIGDAFTCNCGYCDEEEVVVSGEETTTIQAMYEEDRDGDGNKTVCGTDRDFGNRTFPSICYMLCYNHCVTYRIVEVQENDTKKYVLIASKRSK